MGSIANKRGSVRQAPPDVYTPFVTGENEQDIGRDCAKVGADIGYVLFWGIVIVGIRAIWQGIRFFLPW